MIFEDLEFLERFFVDAHVFFYFSMLIIFAVLIENIVFFNQMFPSFGLLFMTLRKVKTDLIIIMIFIFLLLIGFATWANTLDGSMNENFSEFSSGILFLFHYVSEKFKFTHIYCV